MLTCFCRHSMYCCNTNVFASMGFGFSKYTYVYLCNASNATNVTLLECSEIFQNTVPILLCRKLKCCWTPWPSCSRDHKYSRKNELNHPSNNHYESNPEHNTEHQARVCDIVPWKLILSYKARNWGSQIMIFPAEVKFWRTVYSCAVVGWAIESGNNSRITSVDGPIHFE